MCGRRRHLGGMVLGLLAACGSEAPGPVQNQDTVIWDAQVGSDAYSDTDSTNSPDAVPAGDLPTVDRADDVADREPDAGLNAGTVTAWGTIAGACGAVSAAVQVTSAAVLQTTYTFADGASFDPSGLGGKVRQRFEGPNAGGSSKCSEVMSMQLLVDCEGATVTKTETEVVYDTVGKIADYLAELAGVKTGVSVTRAYLGPFVDVYTLEDATTLLEKKLAGIDAALGNASDADKWEKSIVHVWTLHAEWAETVEAAWEALDPQVTLNALVLITVEEGSDYIVTDACAASP